MCALPPDCLSVIALHVDDPTLRAFRLVSVECCAVVAAAAKTRASVEKVTCFEGHVLSRDNSWTIINVAPGWEIRGCESPSIFLDLLQFDRGVIREVVERFPNSGAVYVSRMCLYISHVTLPCFCTHGAAIAR